MNFKKSKAAHLRIGKKGEKCAVALLKNKNCLILARNYKYSHNEIDIVALDGATLVFAEVKTRHKKTNTRPASGLGASQKRRIRKAALHYLDEIENPGIRYRFDLIEVVFSGRTLDELRHWTDHFSGIKSKFSFT